MSTLDRFLANQRAAAQITETDVRDSSTVRKQINQLPPEEQEKWVAIYTSVYNDIVAARGVDKTQEIAARSAWSRVPEQFKKT